MDIFGDQFAMHLEKLYFTTGQVCRIIISWQNIVDIICNAVRMPIRGTSLFAGELHLLVFVKHFFSDVKFWLGTEILEQVKKLKASGFRPHLGKTINYWPFL